MSFHEFQTMDWMAQYCTFEDGTQEIRIIIDNIHKKSRDLVIKYFMGQIKLLKLKKTNSNLTESQIFNQYKDLYDVICFQDSKDEFHVTTFDNVERITVKQVQNVYPNQEFDDFFKNTKTQKSFNLLEEIVLLNQIAENSRDDLKQFRDKQIKKGTFDRTAANQQYINFLSNQTTNTGNINEKSLSSLIEIIDDPELSQIYFENIL